MLEELAWFVCVAWTVVATCAIMRQESGTTLVRKSCQAVARVCRRRKRDTSDTEPAAAELPAPSPFACTRLRIARQIVRPAQRTSSDGQWPTAAARRISSNEDATSSSSTARASVSPPRVPLEFALELQWSAPQNTVNAARKATTYEVQVQAAEGGSFDSASAQAQPTSSPESFDRYSVAVGHDEDVVMSTPEDSPPRSPVEQSPAEQKDVELDSPVLGDLSEDDEKRPRSRKRKSPVGSDRSRSRPASTRSTRGARRAEASSSDDVTPVISAPNSDEEAAPAEAKPASRTLSPHAASTQQIAAVSTFEKPAFVLRNPAASTFTFRVLSAAASMSDSTAPLTPDALISAPLEFTFSLPPLLYLIQSIPRTPERTMQVLQGFEQLTRVLGPADQVEGIDWSGLTQLCHTSHTHHITKRVCNVLGLLAVLPSVVRSLCLHAPLVSALHRLAEHRIRHIAARSDHRPHKRPRKESSHHTSHAIDDTEAPPETTDAAATDGSLPEDPTAADSAESAPAVPGEGDDLIEPVLENLLWLVFGITRLTQAENQAASSHEIVLANEHAVTGFLRVGGGALLQLLCQNAAEAWFAPYEEEALQSLVQLYTSFADELSAGDHDALLFHLLHQATCGTPTARALLQRSAVGERLRNPFMLG